MTTGADARHSNGVYITFVEAYPKGMNFSTYLRQLGRNIKAARKKSGLKQIDVNSCGISYRHYQSIEAGKVNVTIETLYRLANLYKVPISDLVKHD